MVRNISANPYYFFGAGHLIPQYDYVFDHRRRLVQHVLKFEYLTAEFEALIMQYNLTQLTLPTHDVRPSYSKELGVYNMTRTNLQLIEKLYRRDFYEFEYEMVLSTMPEEILQRNQELMKPTGKRGKCRIGKGDL